MGALDAVITAGRASTGVGPAFLVGYRAALRVLTGRPEPGALCVTEHGPPHPRAIEARWTDGRVTGIKRFVTAPKTAEVLWIAARAGESGGRPRIVVVPVDPRGSGVRRVPMPALPFAPEIDHAEVHLDGAPTGEPLPGDGWADAVKPFRTLEDLHVLAALGAWALGSPAGQEVHEGLLAGLAGLQHLAGCSPSAPDTHLALAGVWRAMGPLLDRAGDALPEPARADWLRDRALLAVAGRAREARRIRAWEQRP